MLSIVSNRIDHYILCLLKSYIHPQINVVNSFDDEIYLFGISHQNIPNCEIFIAIVRMDFKSVNSGYRVQNKL